MVGTWRKALSGDILQITCTVHRNGRTFTLHLPAPRARLSPNPRVWRWPSLRRWSAWGSRQRLLTHLQVLSPREWQAAERVLGEL